MSGNAVTYTGDNPLEIEALGVHILNHPTQPALIIFAGKADLDPIGVLAVGQTLEVNGQSGTRIVGVYDSTHVTAQDAAGEQAVIFDPGEHDVDAVNAYLIAQADHQDEIDRVLAVEKAGKNRKGIVGG